MIHIIRQGNPPISILSILYTGTCNICKCIVECETEDTYKYSRYNKFNQLIYGKAVDCPNCRNCISLYELWGIRRWWREYKKSVIWPTIN